MEERLFTRIRQGETPHALLIAGPSGSGKADLARRAAALYCLGVADASRLAGCPNYVEMDGASTNIERVRALMSAVAMKAFNDARRAFVIVDAHRMDARTQNALLKALEEPPAETMLILTGAEMGLLPTIRSRCMIRRIGASPVSEVTETLVREGVPPQRAEESARAADGVTGLAREYASEAGAAFRAEAIRIFMQTLFETAPFAAAAELVTEDVPKEGRKKRPDADKLMRMLVIWEDVLRDALLAPYGMEPRNPDAEKCVRRIAASFTEIEMQGIIETVTIAQQRLHYRASPALTLDAALAKISLKEKV